MPDVSYASEDPGLTVDAVAKPVSGYSPLVIAREQQPTATLESLKAFEVNAFVFEIASRLAADIDAASHLAPVLVYGPPGIGKTHTISVLLDHASCSTLLIHIADWRVEHERARRSGQRAELRRWIAMADLLLVDDIDLCPDDDDFQLEVLAIVQLFCSTKGKALVATSGRSPDKLSLLRPLREQISTGVLCELQIGTAAEREALLRQWVAGWTVPSEVLSYLASRIDDSLLRLRAAARQLIALHDCLALPMSIDLARAALPPDGEQSAEPREAGGEDGVVNEPAEADEQQTTDGPRQRLKEMMSSAETEEEQVLALQIALTERLKQLRKKGSERAIARLERALELLRTGKTEEALKCISL